MRPKTLAKILSNFTVDANGCWNWSGQIGFGGYGRVSYYTGKSYKSESTHRYYYKHYNGDIQSGLFVCHTCDNRKCCNPAHLWLGTHQDNIDDRVSKGRCPSGERNGLNKFTAEQIKSIRTKYNMGFGSYSKLAKELGTNRGHIGKIIRKELWTSI
jgi:HNH endonuclease